ncbi:MAG: hypothetical protein C0429_09070 [Sphingopyxis sp.]|nr:hypothetical protein [Sphingopyxis sp.]
MSASKIFWGQIIAVALIALAGVWGATQWTAAELAYQPELGEPWFGLLGQPVYRPWDLFWWWFSFDAYAPRIFDTAGLIAVSGGFAAIVVAIAMSVYGLFTMRRIAEAADIRLSNLLYYFKTKEDLLNALLKRTVDDYNSALAHITRNRAGSPKAQFQRMIEYLLKDQGEKASCLVFWELWALASRDPSIATIMNGYYDIYLGRVTDAILDITPTMPKRRAQRHAGVIVALIEGASLLRGFGKPRRTSLAGYERAILDFCDQLASESVIVARGQS